MKYIKVNFPDNKKDLTTGNGEGMFVEVDDATAAKYDEDFSGGDFIGTLGNDSWYDPTLKHGAEVHFTMRGEHRPVSDEILRRKGVKS